MYQVEQKLHLSGLSYLYPYILCEMQNRTLPEEMGLLKCMLQYQWRKRFAEYRIDIRPETISTGTFTFV